jgi:serine acetyltransferase
MGIVSLYSEMKRFLKRCRESGLKSAGRNLLIYFNLLNMIRFRDLRLSLACDIDHPQLPASTTIAHPVGIAIAGCTEIGRNVTIHQNVTIGMKNGGCPTICDGAKIYTGAVVIGDLRIGEGAVVGANAVVLDDVPDETTVVGVPARKIQKENKEIK